MIVFGGDSRRIPLNHKDEDYEQKDWGDEEDGLCYYENHWILFDVESNDNGSDESKERSDQYEDSTQFVCHCHLFSGVREYSGEHWRETTAEDNTGYCQQCDVVLLFT